jgi:acyl-CoA thioesterase YciA
MINYPESSLPEGEIATTRVVAMPADTNPAGDIFGGWIMSQADLAGGVAATQRVHGRVVTVAVNSLHFDQPVYVGDLVSCYATVEKVGNTSLTINVVVYAERYGKQQEIVKVTRAKLVYVALDEQGKPVSIAT